MKTREELIARIGELEDELLIEQVFHTEAKRQYTELFNDYKKLQVENRQLRTKAYGLTKTLFTV